MKMIMRRNSISDFVFKNLLSKFGSSSWSGRSYESRWRHSFPELHTCWDGIWTSISRNTICSHSWKGSKTKYWTKLKIRFKSWIKRLLK